MLTGDDQDMNWRSWVDIQESNNLFVLINDFTGALPSDDLTEYAIWIHEIIGLVLEHRRAYYSHQFLLSKPG